MINLNDMTFGVEIETYVNENLLYARGLRVNGYHSQQPQAAADGWRIERDGSLTQRPTRNHVGAEFISPVLRGRDGLRRVLAMVALIKEIGGRVNRTCGLHIHIGWSPDRTARELVDLTTSVSHFEEALFATTGSHRRATSYYCRSIKTSLRGILTLDDMSNLYRVRRDKMQSLNLSTLDRAPDRRTVEFRLFSGTLNPTKITGYLMLALGMVQKATASRKRALGWDAPDTTTTCLTRSGAGATAVERLFKYLNWTREANANVTRFGMLLDTKPEWMRVVKMLRKMARQFDDGRNGNSPGQRALRTRRANEAAARQRTAAAAAARQVAAARATQQQADARAAAQRAAARERLAEMAARQAPAVANEASWDALVRGYVR